MLTTNGNGNIWHFIIFIHYLNLKVDKVYNFINLTRVLEQDYTK